MSLRKNGIIVGLVALGGVLMWAPADQRNLHSEIQQRLLEAEMGSATTFHFAAGSRAMVPDDTATDTLLRNLVSSFPRIR